jgi:8-oxo-dGTP pyrophosphatase MutT (NUDIX family)
MNVPNVDADVLNAHISVMNADEVNKIGVDNINERGHMFSYKLGGMKEIDVRNVDGVSKVWVIEISSPELATLRKSYGLSPRMNGDHAFHITVAVRRKKVLQDNEVRKAAAADLTKLAPKWGEREHILAALPKHLTDTQAAINTGGNVDKEMTDLALIANAWLRSQQQKELLAARLKKFQETAGYPSLAVPKVASELPWRERVEILTRHPRTGKIYGGQWAEDKSFAAPGGGLDPGETPEQAAVRELAEETGIQAANPVLLPIPPVDNPWSDDYRARTGRNFAGSRTHFVVADFVNKQRNKNLDFWSATNRRFYNPEKALALMQDKQFMLPPVAHGRMAAIQHIIDNAVNKQSSELSRSGQKDVLHGGVADNLPDREFSPAALAEGAKHEYEHTNNDQAAKEIAKDHLSEDKSYYEKIKEIEKRSIAAHKDVLAQLLLAKEHSDNKRYAEKTDILRRLMAKAPQDWIVDDPKPYHKGVTHKPTKFRLHTDPAIIPPTVKAAENVYMNQLRNMYSLRRPIVYDYNKPVFENVRSQLMDVKRRGDFMINSRRNHQQYMATLSPQYRYELAMKAMRGEMEEPNLAEQVIYNNGDHLLNAAFGRPQ